LIIVNIPKLLVVLIRWQQKAAVFFVFAYMFVIGQDEVEAEFGTIALSYM